MILKPILRKIFYGIQPLFSDELALRFHTLVYGYPRLNLKKPESFQDKVNYLKLTYRKPILTTFSDKLEAKSFINDNYSQIKTAKVYQIANDINDLNFEKLPNKFVLKSNFSSGDSIVVRNKDEINKKELLKHFDYRNLRSPYDTYKREWGYKNIDKKIFAEEYLESSTDLIDYKFFCFRGNVPFLHVVSDRYTGLKDYILDTNWVNLNFNFSKRSYVPNELPPKPFNYELMLQVAKNVSVNFPFIRVDFFEHKGNAYFSEFTFYPWGGFYNFQPKEAAKKNDAFVSKFLDLDNLQ